MYPTWTSYDPSDTAHANPHVERVAGDVSADVKGDLKACFHWEPYFFDYDDDNDYDPVFDPDYNARTVMATPFPIRRMPPSI